MHKVGDDAPGWLEDYRLVEVDVGGLHAFAGAVDAEVDANLRPHAERLVDAYAPGVRFGTDTISGEVRAARLRYHECLVGVTEQLAACVNASKILSAAARAVARRYAGADALSAAAVGDVEAALTRAAFATSPAAAPQDRPSGTRGYA
jgi:hypothetical protein